MPSTAAPSPATPTALRHVDDQRPGIARRRCGKGFRYVDADGRAVRDAATLARIRRLAIPPAWTGVWICPLAEGHLQATGRDARGRKQYRYHAEWTARRSRHKFEQIVQFGGALPGIRRQLRAHLRLRGLPRERVLAIVVAVMDQTLARIGNVQYARQNRSYGLTTLRKRHLDTLTDHRARLRFRGKAGQLQTLEVADRQLARLIGRCRELPGSQLFQYLDDDGQVCQVDSGQVNAYLQSLTGSDYTAKDFRTWGATLQAIGALAGSAPEADAPDSSVQQRQHAVVCEVAGLLGNTPAVCRTAYIDPCVFAAWRAGRLRTLRPARSLGGRERQALALLRRCHRSSAD